MQLPVNYDETPMEERRLVREEYVRVQEGRCCHCGNPLDGRAADEIMSKRINMKLFPPNFLKHPVHLHHDHKTGMTIGAVHSHCNAVLWQYHGQ